MFKALFGENYVKIRLISPKRVKISNMSDITLFNQTEDELGRPKEFFNQQWKIYQKLLNNNYMAHREIYSHLHELLVNYFQKPFTMLELGCGDASFTSQALLNTHITSYKGIDLSIPALEIAKQNMTVAQFNATFTQDDFSVAIAELAQSQPHTFDAIFMSFALHHLNLEQKDEFIGQIKPLLTSDGVFILIDIISQEEEERETYIGIEPRYV